MKPKILIYDIETTPNIGYTWGMWDQNVIEFIEEWKILCVAYKWYGSNKVCYFGQNTERMGCDRKVTTKLHALFDEADITVAHNGDAFDKKKANAKFLEYGLKPPSTYSTVDTLKVARRQFKLNSNKLNDLGKLLGCGQKVAHGGFALWKGCMAGDEKAWRSMERYAKQDVRLLERVYKKLLPWIDSHPNYGMFSDSDEAVCPNCGHTKLRKCGFMASQTRLYQRYQCNSCGRFSKSVKCEPNNGAIVK